MGSSEAEIQHGEELKEDPEKHPPLQVWLYDGVVVICPKGFSSQRLPKVSGN